MREAGEINQMSERVEGQLDDGYTQRSAAPAGLRFAQYMRRSSIPATVLSLAAVLLLWWSYSLALKSAVLMPSPPAVMARLVRLITTSSDLALGGNVWASLRRVLIGWGAGVSMGVIVGASMASNQWIRGALDPLIELVRPIPPLAFAPLLIVWFGIGELPKDLILFYASFPILAIATASAILGVDRTWKLAAQTLGASPAYILRRVIIPAALPGILTGVRIASGITWGTLIAAEIIASTQGLGWMIIQAGRYLDVEAIFVGIIVIGTLAFLMDRLLRLFEHVLVPWRGR
jgi:taurine transport system permease protein